MLLKASVNILLQGVPEGVDIEKLDAAIRAVAGVTDVHNLHVLGLTSGKTVMSAHVIVDPAQANERQVIPSITKMVEHDFDIQHSTVQVEIIGVKVHSEDAYLAP